MLADLRFAYRQLIKAPGFTGIAVLTLGLAIATATTMFTLFNAVLLRPLPFFSDEDRLLVIRTVDSREPKSDFEFSFPNYYDVAEQNHTLSGVLTNENRTYVLGGCDRPKRVFGTLTTVDSFQALGVRPVRGRLFRVDDANPDATPVALVSYNFWKESLGGADDVVGQAVTLDNRSLTIVGVMPENFHFPDGNDLWQPFPRDVYRDEKHRGAHNTQVYARMKPGVSLEQVQADLDVIAKRLAAAHPVTNTGLTFRALTVREEATRDVQRALRLMMAAVVAVLLIACANVANLLLARGAGRGREFAVRLALGADRARVRRQVLTESLLLGGLGGALGVVLSLWELDFVLGLIPDIPYWLRFDIDWRVAAFVTVATVVTSLLFGSFPALHLPECNLSSELKEGQRGGTSSRNALRLRSGLVVAQIALALVLLVLGGLAVRSFLALQHVETGIAADHVLTFRTGIPKTMIGSDRAALPFFDRVVQELRAVPGVENVGFITTLPLTDSRDRETFLVNGMPEPASNQEWPISMRRNATPGVFSVLQIPLLQGRLFDEHDRLGSPLVAVVDQRFAHRFFPGRSAIGQRITFDDPGPKRDWFTIVGIVGNITQMPTDAEADPAVWTPFAQVPDMFATAVVRVRDEPNAYIRAATDAVLAARSDIPIYYPRPMSEVAHRALWKQRMFGALFTAFAMIALFLATIGIYGVMSYSISQRRQEIGIRMALGAEPRAVIVMVLKHGLRLIVTGLVVGLTASWYVAVTLTGILHGIQPHDPPTFAAVPVLLASVALIACYVPGRRATLIDPLIALRGE